ncbi:hypothetical protein PoB_003772500 [Plakobranchus ocellatus]|uniref:Uncharacterized protein n=1 Tax=Plakobranchus ocellatus TaxID=259542 RepID=A0AAV4AWK2_9GAST|nr:hypothetical protein PoB_003772500 [Plakobranchus ocellatus]
MRTVSLKLSSQPIFSCSFRGSGRNAKQLTIESFPYHGGGYLLVRSAIELASSVSPVFGIGYDAALPLRSAGQSELFPSEFIHIWNAYGPGDRLCGRFADKCIIYCRGIGSHISRMLVKQIASDGTASYFPSRLALQEYNIPEFLMTIEWEFDPKDVTDDNGDVTFQCWAFDDTAHIEAKHDYHLHFDDHD